MANLIIDFTGFKQIRLRLLDNDQEIDGVDFSFDSNLDTVLIESVDKLLKKNTITESSLSGVQVVGDVNPNSAAYKVAQTFVEAVKTFKKYRHH
jgi:hypothetical protein